MTNEQLAAFIKQGDNDELIPILWERIRKIMYMKSDSVYSTLQGRFQQCGVDIWDLKQSCYMAFLRTVLLTAIILKIKVGKILVQKWESAVSVSVRFYIKD